MHHLGWIPAKFEFHGNQLWNGNGEWKNKTPDELLAAYESVIGLIDKHNISIAHSTIDRQKLHDNYTGNYDASAYRLGLQFLLEKIDTLPGLKIVVADESKEQEVEAKDMVAQLQAWGGGEVPGRQVDSVIDSMHFVQSHESPGVQMADMVAYLLHRARLTTTEQHPYASASRRRMLEVINFNTPTYRMTLAVGGHQAVEGATDGPGSVSSGPQPAQKASENRRRHAPLISQEKDSRPALLLLLQNCSARGSVMRLSAVEGTGHAGLCGQKTRRRCGDYLLVFCNWTPQLSRQ